MGDGNMADPGVREPEQVRRDCARKLRQVEASPRFTAVLACLLGEDWTTPRIEQLCLRPDGCLLAQTAGQGGFNTFLGPAADLVRNLRALAPVAELDRAELTYLLSRVANLKGP